MKTAASKAVFLDRDGVINQDGRRPNDLRDLSILPGVDRAIKKLNERGYRVVVVTNQAAIAKGLTTPAEVDALHYEILARLAKVGASIDGFYYCPHHPEGTVPEYAGSCNCRKPEVGMIEMAAKNFDIDLTKSFLVGDKTGDILAGKNAGLKTILVQTGYGGSDGLFDVTPDLVAENLLGAVNYILSLEASGKPKKGIVLAGGEGKRLESMGFNVPKPLVMIKDKPLINYNLGLFDKYGVRDVKVIIRPSDRAVYSKWQGEYGKIFPDMKIDLVEEPQPMGTFGYFFHHLRDWMDSENIFVTNGDDIKDIDLGEMEEFHRKNYAHATLALMKMEKPDDYGAVLVKENKVKEFIEKKPNLPPGFVSAGMYIVSPSALEKIAARIPPEKKYLMFEKDLFPALASDESLGGFICEGKFYDCGTPERFAEAERAVRES